MGTDFTPANSRDAAAGPEPSGEESDAALMERAMQGDRPAFAALFKRHAPRIYRSAYLLLHNSQAAADVLQETFARGLEHIRSYRAEAEPRAWFASIAINLCRRLLRDEEHEPDATDPDTLDRARPAGRPKMRGVLTSMIRREHNRRLALALGYLTPPQREVFVLHYVDDLPYEEIGRMLETTPGAARALAHRARAILREKLGADPTV